MSPEIRHEITEFIRKRPLHYVFSNGVSASVDVSDDLLWLSSPYGVDTAVSYQTPQELRQKLKKYLEFWCVSRNERGDALSL